MDAVTLATVVTEFLDSAYGTIARYAAAGEVVRLAGVTAGPRRSDTPVGWPDGDNPPDTSEFALRIGNFSAGYCRPRHLWRGISDVVIQAILRHSNVSVTRAAYIKNDGLDPQSLAAMEALESAVGNQNAVGARDAEPSTDVKH